MELTQALFIINDSIAKKQSEIDSLKLALSSLEGKFAPELEVFENLKQEVMQKEAFIQQKIEENETLKEQLSTIEVVSDTIDTPVTEPVLSDTIVPLPTEEPVI